MALLFFSSSGSYSGLSMLAHHHEGTSVGQPSGYSGHAQGTCVKLSVKVHEHFSSTPLIKKEKPFNFDASVGLKHISQVSNLLL